MNKLSSWMAFMNGGAPAFVRLYISLFLGIEMSDIAFKFNYLDSDFIEPSTYAIGPSKGYIPYDTPNMDKIFNEQQSFNEPDQIILLGPGSNSYIKVGKY